MKQTIFLTIIFTLFFIHLQNAQAQEENPDVSEMKMKWPQLFGKQKVKGLKLGFSTPNELKSYKFFGKGKLKGLKLGISTKEDIKGIWGATCEEICIYNSKWNVLFNYFDIDTSFTIESFDGSGHKVAIKNFLSLPEYHGRLRSVRLIPKKRVSFNQVSFPDEFEKFSSVIFGHDFSGHAAGIAIDFYTDSYGLKYAIFDKVNYTTFKEKEIRRKGDLISIEYQIPREVETKMFEEVK
jgi:hypothetical protein